MQNLFTDTSATWHGNDFIRKSRGTIRYVSFWYTFSVFSLTFRKTVCDQVKTNFPNLSLWPVFFLYKHIRLFRESWQVVIFGIGFPIFGMSKKRKKKTYKNNTNFVFSPGIFNNLSLKHLFLGNKKHVSNKISLTYCLPGIGRASWALNNTSCSCRCLKCLCLLRIVQRYWPCFTSIT